MTLYIRLIYYPCFSLLREIRAELGVKIGERTLEAPSQLAVHQHVVPGTASSPKGANLTCNGWQYQ